MYSEENDFSNHSYVTLTHGIRQNPLNSKELKHKMGNFKIVAAASPLKILIVLCKLSLALRLMSLSVKMVLFHWHVNYAIYSKKLFLLVV